MQIEYEKYMERITDESIKEVLELVFTEAFPKVIRNCESEYISANMFVSFSEMLKSVQMNGFNSTKFDTYIIYQEYTDFCYKLFDWIDSLESSGDKNTIYEILDKVTAQIIVDLICDGINNGSISADDLNMSVDMAKENDYYETLKKFCKLDDYHKLDIIMGEVSKVRELLAYYNQNLYEDHRVLPVVEDDEDDDISDKLNIIYSYVCSIKEEVARVIDIIKDVDV